MSLVFEQKPQEWLQMSLKRFKNQVLDPGPPSRQKQQAIGLVQESLIQLSSQKFSSIVLTLASYLRDIPTINALPPEDQQSAILSNKTVLETIEQCFLQHLVESSELSDDEVQKHLLPAICPLILHPEADSELFNEELFVAGRLIYFISLNHFTVVFDRIIKRLTSLAESGEDSAVRDDLELIKYLHVPLLGLTVLLDACGKCFTKLKKNAQCSVIKALNLAIWNWIEKYPVEFTLLYRQPNVQLSEQSEKMFALVDHFAEATKRKLLAWPLLVMLLLLGPESIQEASGSGELTKGSNFVKRAFLDNLRQGLRGNKQLQGYALVACVQLCRASTFINREDNIVCFLVSQVMNELKSMLFTADKPFSASAGVDVEQLMVDLYVASFRINYHNNQHFEVCFQPDAPASLQIAMVRSLYQIVTEEPMKWWPTINVIYGRSTQLRHSFQQCIRRMTSYDPNLPKAGVHRASLSKIKERKQKEEDLTPFQRDADLLFWMVKLFHADPMIGLHNDQQSGADMQASSMQLLNGLVVIMMFTNITKLASEVAETLLTLHTPSNIEIWNPQAPMRTFWEISSHIVYNVADRLLTERIPNPVDAMRWLRRILKCRIQFLERSKENALDGTHNSICSEALTKLEVLFLTSLWSVDMDRVRMAMKSFGLLHKEANILATDRPSPIHPPPLTTVYYRLASEVLQTGRSALHKSIMSILKDVATDTPGNVKAWDLTFARWQRMTSVLTNYPREELFVVDSKSKDLNSKKNVTAGLLPTEALEACITEWTKMTGFLCSLGGIFGGQVVYPKRQLSSSSVRHLKTQTSNAVILADAPVNRFISELLTLLVCENEHTSLQIRSAVRESVSFDLSTSLYPAFFSLCHATTKCFFEDEDQLQPRIQLSNSVYAEQVIYVMRCIMESKSDEVAGVLSSLAVEDVLLALFKYIRALPLSVSSLVIKSKICQLVENVMTRRADLSFRQEMKFRNKLVDYLSDWVLTGSDIDLEMSKEIVAISCTLDEAAIKSIAALLKGLPLQPELIESDVAEAKSQLFLKHFTLFMNILNKCYDVPEEKKHLGHKGDIAPHFANLRASTVQAMSNMLSANIDSGLTHSIGLGYHDDPQTRATFMEVLTDILKQGTEFENLADTVLEDRFERLVRLVMNTRDSDHLPVAVALCHVVSSEQMDDVAKVLVNICDSCHILPNFLGSLFRFEVDSAEGPQTLFRGNTIASKAMTYCFRIYGGGYLNFLIQPLIEEMEDTPEKCYEVDPLKLEAGVSVESNVQNCLKLAQKFVDKVDCYKDSFPPQLRTLCFCLNQAVQKRFPSETFDAVSSAVFLRFINPAIVSPQSHGLCHQTPSPNVKRALMLLSKILQNLANHLVFAKEAHMEVFNDFLQKNFNRIQRFFQSISAKVEVCMAEKDDPLIYTSDPNIMNLHRLLWDNQEKMGKYFALNRDYKELSRDPYDKLTTLLAHLGPPEKQFSRLERRLNRHNSIGWRLENFIANQTGQNQDELERVKALQMFYRDGISRAGHDVFYYIARRYRNDQIADEIFLYHVVMTLQDVSSQSWELFLDFSHTNPDNNFKMETIARAVVVLPQLQLSNLKALYFYNVSSSVRQFVKLKERVMQPIKAFPNLVFIDKLSQTYSYIEESQLKLPASTTALENDLKYFTLSRFMTKGTVQMKIGPDNIQLQLTDKVKMLGYLVVVNDVFYASEIETVSYQDDMLDFEFTSKRLGLKFLTPQAKEIAEAVLRVQQRWKLSKSDQKTMKMSKKIRPKDVPGTLLNMALLNLGSNDPGLRLAAYNLLCALTSTFGLHINERLLEAQGICIPANCTLFIKSISEQLAEREPNLTLEFLDECISAFEKCSHEAKSLCLNYMAPWLQNLTRFCTFNENDSRRKKVVKIINKLIKLTIAERQMYPTIQAYVWGNVGKIPELLDVVLDCFVKTSTAGGFGSEKAEVMADTTVALASGNMSLVSQKILDRFHLVLGRTTVSPTRSLERHLMWDDIAILARYFLMLSFNDSLDVIHHLADIFHIITLLVSTGPMSLRASLHGLTINCLQSLLTCTEIVLSDKTQLVIRSKLEDFSLPRFYLLFGISKVKYAPAKAFMPRPQGRSRTFAKEEDSGISLSSLEVITEALLDVVEACMNDKKDSPWMSRWLSLVSGVAFKYNPAVQPRALVVLGTITKELDEEIICQVLETLAKACGFYLDFQLVEAALMCLAKFQLLISESSEYGKILFWVAVGILQFGQQQLYPAALHLLEQNLLFCNKHGLFDKETIESVMMGYRNDNSYYWICKQLDHMTGLSFNTSFHFSLVALIVKGFRLSSAKTASCTGRILTALLSICSKNSKLTSGSSPWKKSDSTWLATIEPSPSSRSSEKFCVAKDTVPYLAALLATSEEVRARLQPASDISAYVSAVAKQQKCFTPIFPPDVTVTSFENDRPPSAFRWPPEVKNALLEPAVLDDQQTQVLLIVFLATMADHTMDDAETRVLFEVLAEASAAYPDVFSVAYGIIGRKLNNILSHSEDPVTLAAAHRILYSTSCLPASSKTIKLQLLTSIGFPGLQSIPGPFTESSEVAVAPQMYARLVDAMLVKCSPDKITADSRSTSTVLFKPPTSVDDQALCTSSTSLDAIAPGSSPQSSGGGFLSVFKRVGSYSPAKRNPKKEQPDSIKPVSHKGKL